MLVKSMAQLAKALSCDQKIMGSNKTIQILKLAMGLGKPLDKQTFIDAAVHPAVMGS